MRIEYLINGFHQPERYREGPDDELKNWIPEIGARVIPFPPTPERECSYLVADVRKFVAEGKRPIVVICLDPENAAAFDDLNDQKQYGYGNYSIEVDPGIFVDFSPIDPNRFKKGHEKKKILFLCDYKASTGFGTVSNNLIPLLEQILPNNWVFDICAINYFDKPIQETRRRFVFSGFKASMQGSNPQATKDDFGRTAFLRVLYQSNEINENTDEHPSELGYDGLFIIQDAPVACGMVANLETIKREFRQKNKKNFKSILYFPVDNDLIPQFIKDIEFFDQLVTYNEYSRNCVARIKPELRKRIKIIPHGIDPSTFYFIRDMEQREDFRKEYFGENADKFIVMNLNRNQPRKDIPCTIMAFQEFKKDHPDSFLYLHMNPADPLGWNLHHVLQQTDLVEGKDFMFPPAAVQNHGTDLQTLNKIYNACDVYVTTTLGEGWGLGVTEAMAAELPVIAPNHTSFLEIGNHGERIYALENLYPYCGINDNVIRQQCDYQEVAEKLALVKEEKETGSMHYHSKLFGARKYMEDLWWGGLANQWADIILKNF